MKGIGFGLKTLFIHSVYYYFHLSFYNPIVGKIFCCKANNTTLSMTPNLNLDALANYMQTLILILILIFQHMIYSGERGWSGGKKLSFACIKVQDVMDLLLFTELLNLCLWRNYGALKFRGIAQSYTKYRG